MAFYQSSGGSTGGGGMFLGGAAAGAGAVMTYEWGKKVQSRANVGMGLGIANTAISVVGGNDNSNESKTAADLVNTVNSRALAAAPTGTEVGLIRGDLANLAGIVSRGLANTDPIKVVGLRNPATVPAPNYGPASVSTTTSTAPASGFGNVGFLLLIGLGVWLATRND